MSEASSGKEKLSLGFLLSSNIIFKSNLRLFLEHPDFNPFPAFQDLHGLRLFQLEKSCFDQQNSMCTKREFRDSVAEENIADQFLNNFGRTEWLWFPADSLEGEVVCPVHQKRRVKGALRQFGGVEGM